MLVLLAAAVLWTCLLPTSPRRWTSTANTTKGKFAAAATHCCRSVRQATISPGDANPGLVEASHGSMLHWRSWFSSQIAVLVFSLRFALFFRTLVLWQQLVHAVLWNEADSPIKYGGITVYPSQMKRDVANEQSRPATQRL